MSKVFNFPVEKELPTKSHMNVLTARPHRNAMVFALEFAYSNHYALAISPDNILNTVATIWSKYVLIHAEDFRHHFVEHEGKKDLIYHSSGNFSEDRMPELLSGLLNLVNTDQSDSKSQWMDADFTTTLEIDQLLRATCMLASQQEYYSFGMSLSCGFPEITLLGEDSDWGELKVVINRMPTLDDEKLEEWKNNLLSIVDDMLTGDEDFWQRCVTLKRYGSGDNTRTGWISAFTPFDSKGEWYNENFSITDRGILDLNVDFPVTINDNGKVFEISVNGGVKMLAYENDRIEIKPLFSIEEKS